jgi:hypothetical protein
MKPRAFVINIPLLADGTPTVSLRPAEFFGTVTQILPAGKPPPDPMESVTAIETAMADYTADDFIVLVGEMDLIAIATAFAMEATGGHVNFLKWDRTHRAYFPYAASLPQLFTDLDDEDADGNVEDATEFDDEYELEN